MSSLRWRTALAFAALPAVVAVVMSVVVYRTSVSERSSRLRSLAVQEARSAATIYGSTRALVDGATLNDPSAPTQLRGAVARGQSASQLVSVAGTSTVWGGAPVGNVDVTGLYVRLSAAGDARALQSLRDTLALTSLGIIVAGAIGGVGLGAALSRRLRRAAGAAQAITAGDLRARVNAGGRDEVGVLSDAVDAMADALGARIDRERQFNADVAHELRTPVTGLLAAAGLLPEDDEVAEMVRERSRRLHRLVEDLLEIARLEGGGETAELRALDLRAFAEEIASRYDHVTVTGQAQRDTDPRRLERVVVNLVENGLTHGGAPLEIRIAPVALSVSDSGPGFPDADGRPLIERFVTHSKRGNGLGLAIAYEQARVIGAELILENPPSGGACATLRWPA